MDAKEISQHLLLNFALLRLISEKSNFHSEHVISRLHKTAIIRVCLGNSFSGRHGHFTLGPLRDPFGPEFLFQMFVKKSLWIFKHRLVNTSLFFFRFVRV